MESKKVTQVHYCNRVFVRAFMAKRNAARKEKEDGQRAGLEQSEAVSIHLMNRVATAGLKGTLVSSERTN
ncbi:MAG: hypothetical protein M1816_004943 [Peltula sp. TS41687]|nr:MAG: hypothetical protein M1816_004943 [Peltula sp. TS41687]